MPIRSFALVALVASLSVLASAAARAEAPVDDEEPPSHVREAVAAPVAPYAEPAPAPPRERVRWYGWKIMMLDVGTLAATVLTGPFGGLSFLAGPAFVHAAHGRSRAAYTSVLLRAGLPFAGAMGGMFLASYAGDVGHTDDSIGNMLGGLAIGAGAGMLTAMVLDYTVLSAADPLPRASEPGRPAYGMGIAPQRGGLTLSFGGTF